MLVVLGCAVAVLGASAWHSLRVARAELEVARTTLETVAANPATLAQAGPRAGAEAQIVAALGQIEAARHELHHSPGFEAAAILPGLRSQRAGILRLVDDSATASATGRDLLAEVDTLAGGLRLSAGAVPLDALGSLAATARSAATRLAALDRPARGLWGPIADIRRKFDDIDGRLSSRLASGASDLGAARGFLGDGGTRTYLMAFENNAEMRDQGIVLEYAVMTASGGHLAFGRRGHITDLTLRSRTATAVPAGTQAFFGYMGPTQIWPSVNATADFAFSGKAMTDMYAQATGEHVDGVIAVDVPGLAALLRTIGPVQVPGVSEPITSDDAGTVLLHDLYAADPSPSQAVRYAHLGDVAVGVMHTLTGGQFDAVSLGQDLGTASAGGHIKLYSADPVEESTFEHNGIGGSPGAIDAAHTFHVAVENRLATKMDYYIKPSVVQSIYVTTAGTAIVHTTVNVADVASAGAPRGYQLGPDPAWTAYAPSPGDYIAWVLCWGPYGSTQPDSTPESGLRLSQAAPVVHAGGQVTVQFDTIIPNAVTGGKLSLRYVPQPRLTPDALAVTVSAPGWSVAGPRSWQGLWDRTVTMTWGLQRS